MIVEMLTHRIQIYEKVRKSDGRGGWIEEYQRKGQFWASVEENKPTIEGTNQIVFSDNIKIVMRKNPELTIGYNTIINYNDNDYEVQGVTSDKLTVTVNAKMVHS